MSNQEEEEISKVVLFSLEEPRYAIHLSNVERVIQAVEITPLPHAPDIVSGVINVEGQILPVIDIRQLFKLPFHELSTEDQFIIAVTPKRRFVLVVDEVIGVSLLANNQIATAEESLPYTNYLSGITVFENNIILINDLEKFLSLDEQRELDKALKG